MLSQLEHNTRHKPKQGTSLKWSIWWVWRKCMPRLHWYNKIVFNNTEQSMKRWQGWERAYPQYAFKDSIAICSLNAMAQACNIHITLHKNKARPLRWLPPCTSHTWRCGSKAHAILLVRSNAWQWLYIPVATTVQGLLVWCSLLENDKWPLFFIIQADSARPSSLLHY